MATLYKPMDVQVAGNGVTMAGAKLYFYTTGTSTPQDTYSQSDLDPGHVNPNPVLADSNGLWPPIYLGATDYKAILKTSADVTIQTIDPVLVNPQAASLSDEIDDEFGSTQYSLLQRGASEWEAVTLKSVLDTKFGTDQGSIIYRSGSDWVALAAPDEPSRLTHAGGANNPAWERRAFAQGTVVGGSVTINKQIGFSTINRDAAGLFTCTLADAMPDLFYRVLPVGSVEVSGSVPNGLLAAEDIDTPRTTTVFHLVFGLDSSGTVDPDAFSIEVFG